MTIRRIRDRASPLGKRRRARRDERTLSKQEEAYTRARDEELKRQNAARRQAMEQDVFATTEGQGIMEGASVSLGMGDDDEDDLFDQFGTGLLI